MSVSNKGVTSDKSVNTPYLAHGVLFRVNCERSSGSSQLASSSYRVVVVVIVAVVYNCYKFMSLGG